MAMDFVYTMPDGSTKNFTEQPTVERLGLSRDWGVKHGGRLLEAFEKVPIDAETTQVYWYTLDGIQLKSTLHARNPLELNLPSVVKKTGNFALFNLDYNQIICKMPKACLDDLNYIHEKSLLSEDDLHTLLPSGNYILYHMYIVRNGEKHTSIFSDGLLEAKEVTKAACYDFQLNVDQWTVAKRCENETDLIPADSVRTLRKVYKYHLRGNGNTFSFCIAERCGILELLRIGTEGLKFDREQKVEILIDTSAYPDEKASELLRYVFRESHTYYVTVENKNQVFHEEIQSTNIITGKDVLNSVCKHGLVNQAFAKVALFQSDGQQVKDLSLKLKPSSTLSVKHIFQWVFLSAVKARRYIHEESCEKAIGFEILLAKQGLRCDALLSTNGHLLKQNAKVKPGQYAMIYMVELQIVGEDGNVIEFETVPHTHKCLNLLKRHCPVGSQQWLLNVDTGKPLNPGSTVRYTMDDIQAHKLRFSTSVRNKMVLLKTNLGKPQWKATIRYDIPPNRCLEAEDPSKDHFVVYMHPRHRIFDLALVAHVSMPFRMTKTLKDTRLLAFSNNFDPETRLGTIASGDVWTAVPGIRAVIHDANHGSHRVHVPVKTSPGRVLNRTMMFPSDEKRFLMHEGAPVHDWTIGSLASKVMASQTNILHLEIGHLPTTAHMVNVTLFKVGEDAEDPLILLPTFETPSTTMIKHLLHVANRQLKDWPEVIMYLSKKHHSDRSFVASSKDDSALCNTVGQYSGHERRLVVLISPAVTVNVIKRNNQESPIKLHMDGLMTVPDVYRRLDTLGLMKPETYVLRLSESHAYELGLKWNDVESTPHEALAFVPEPFVSLRRIQENHNMKEIVFLCSEEHEVWVKVDIDGVFFGSFPALTTFEQLSLSVDIVDAETNEWIPWFYTIGRIAGDKDYVRFVTTAKSVHFYVLFGYQCYEGITVSSNCTVGHLKEYMDRKHNGKHFVTRDSSIVDSLPVALLPVASRQSSCSIRRTIPRICDLKEMVVITVHDADGKEEDYTVLVDLGDDTLFNFNEWYADEKCSIRIFKGLRCDTEVWKRKMVDINFVLGIEEASNVRKFHEMKKVPYNSYMELCRKEFKKVTDSPYDVSITVLFVDLDNEDGHYDMDVMCTELIKVHFRKATNSDSLGDRMFPRYSEISSLSDCIDETMGDVIGFKFYLTTDKEGNSSIEKYQNLSKLEKNETLDPITQERVLTIWIHKVVL